MTVMRFSKDHEWVRVEGGIATVVRRRRLTMTVAHDQSGTVISSLNPRAANPYTLFIDRQGRVAHRHEGYSPGDERKYEALIDALLAER